MTEARPLDVLVAGAGPTGLTLASEILRHGGSCRIVDALPQPVTYSKAAVVHARTMEVFDAMGVAAPMLERTRTLRANNVHANGRRVAHIDFKGIDSAFPSVYGISQRDTEEVLAAHLVRLGGTVERGARLEAFTQDEAGVRATVLRADGSQEQVHARYLVGSDGAHSVVRKQLGFAFEGAPYEERLIQADLRITFASPVADDEIQIFLDERGPVMLFPLFKDGRYRIILFDVGAPSTAADREPVLEDFQCGLDARGIDARVSDPAWTVAFRIHHRHVDRLREGRAFIAGDAAHIHSPVGGQGMNTGIQDAFNLGWKLAAVATGRGRPSLLDSYAPERLPVIAALIAGTDRATRAMEVAVNVRHPIAQGLRNQLLSVLTSFDLFASQATQAISMLGVGYAGSPLSGEDRGGLWKASEWAAFGSGPAPGMRAPDATVEDGKGSLRVQELLRAGSSVALLFAGDSAAAEGLAGLSRLSQSLRARHGRSVSPYVVIRQPIAGLDEPTLLDGDGALHKRYGAHAGAISVLRPDGYVGYRAQPAELDRVHAWCDRLFVPTA